MGTKAHQRIFGTENGTDQRPAELIEAVARRTNELVQLVGLSHKGFRALSAVDAVVR